MKRNLLFFFFIAFNNLFSFELENQFPQEQPPSYSEITNRSSLFAETNIDEDNLRRCIEALTASISALESEPISDEQPPSLQQSTYSWYNSQGVETPVRNNNQRSFVSEQPRNNNSSYRTPGHNSQRSCIPCCSSDSNCCKIRKETITFTIGEHHQEFTTVRPYASKIERTCSENAVKLCCFINPQNNKPACEKSACKQSCCIICCCPLSTALVTTSAIPCLLSCTVCSVWELTYAAVAYPLNMIRGTVD